MRPSVIAVLPLASLALAGPASAQSTGPDIVVTGRGLPASPGERAFDIVTIDRDRLQAKASQRLESVLADVAGLQQFRRSDSRTANPTSQGITLRGIGGNASSRALLILDGVPQADPFGGWVAFPAYATGRLGQVRVTRGGGSGYFGPGALAGTIQLDSATPDQLSPLEASAFYGSRQAVEAQGSAALVRGGGFATLSAAYARGDGFVPTVAASRGPVDRAAPYEQASGALRTVVTIAPSTEVQANVSAFTDRRERGTAFTANRSQGADASVRLVGRGRWGWSALAYLQTRAFASGFASVNAARTTVSQSLDQYNTPATGLGARLEVQPPVGDAVDLRLGADIRDVSGKTQELFTFVNAAPTRRREAGGSTRTNGIFVDGSVASGALTLTGAARVDWWSIDGGYLSERPVAGGAALTDNRFANRDGSEFTGRVGAAWRPVDAVTLRGAAYRGWRLPTLNELYRPFRVGNDITAANAALAPERLTGIEGGVTLTPFAGASLAATVFRNQLDDAIANVTLSSTATSASRVRRNLDAIRSTGLEVDARYALGAFDMLASWSHIDARVRSSGAAAALDGLRPAQTPRDAVSGTIGWRQRGVALSATVRHVASQFDDDQNSRSLAPATTLDGFAALPVTRGIAIEARAENVFDARVEAGISGANIVERATPRTLWIGVRAKIG
ncbi:outer membrane receptor protein involved in Fe transport [Sphingomonas insulae]|uniref:TonB-dependent receptor n=1 Tax=Sphingomonas insulae TaxID=424800 RepID=A0ABP3SZL6_9SPHN|nr:TonB-dependent receptor [Sphingomonas insulae]NIJ28762.1 outer membrane receptor protein involved in Fe transport [Sphingomonas insulae]